MPTAHGEASHGDSADGNETPRSEAPQNGSNQDGSNQDGYHESGVHGATTQENGPQDNGQSDGAPDPEIVVYTRPGCPFCVALRAGLRRYDLDFHEVDIWEDAEAAATVRSLADGNETVPTVVIGPWSAVNPSPDAVRSAVGTHAPTRLPESRPGLIEGALRAVGLRRTPAERRENGDDR